jgi:hypothetical protein
MLLKTLFLPRGSSPADWEKPDRQAQFSKISVAITSEAACNRMLITSQNDNLENKSVGVIGSGRLVELSGGGEGAREMGLKVVYLWRRGNEHRQECLCYQSVRVSNFAWCLVR